MTSDSPRERVPERRLYAIHELEVRAAPADDGAIPMSGYAALFGERSNVLYDLWTGAFVEEIEPGAFAKTLRDGADVRLLINHDPNLVLARTRSGTLRLAEDERGLRVEADMAPTSYAQDLAISMRRGDVTQMSFAFRVIKDTWNETEEGLPLRRIQEVALYDTAIVTYPAYEATEAGLRQRQFHSEAELDHFLTDLLSHDITPARLPVLRAVRTALDRRLATVEPVAPHSTVDLDAMRRKIAESMQQRRHVS